LQLVAYGVEQRVEGGVLARLLDDLRGKATRRAAYDAPWSQLFLRALELDAYRALRAHEPGWLARRLGLDPGEEQRSLELLRHSGQIVLDGGRYRPARVTTVDTRRDPDAAHRLRVFYSRVGTERLAQDASAASAYNLFGVSARTWSACASCSARTSARCGRSSPSPSRSRRSCSPTCSSSS
jgi:hypothetical protein